MNCFVFLKGRGSFPSLSVAIKGGGVKQKKITSVSVGHSNNMQNKDLPQMIRFPLPFRSAPRNFKDPIVKRAAKNPRNHVAFASANGGGVLCRLKQPGIRPLSLLSVVSLCE